jgi:hypothetical protein
MMIDTVYSKNNIPIRLTQERWEHILAGHPEMATSRDNLLMTVSDPGLILEGQSGEFLAVRSVELDKWLIVAYRELIGDGFIITAFFTRRREYLEKRKALWP